MPGMKLAASIRMMLTQPYGPKKVSGTKCELGGSHSLSMNNTLWSRSELEMGKDTRTSGKFSEGPERLEAWLLRTVTAMEEWSCDPQTQSPSTAVLWTGHFLLKITRDR